MTQEARDAGPHGFDPSKPFTTKDGRTVEAFEPNADKFWVWKGFVGGRAQTWRVTGEWRDSDRPGAPYCRLDLINIEPDPSPAAAGQESDAEDVEYTDWQSLAEAAIADLENYAEDETSARRLVSYRAYSANYHWLAERDRLRSELAARTGKVSEDAKITCRTRDRRVVTDLRLEGRSGCLLGSINDEPMMWHPGGFWAGDHSEQPLDLEFAAAPPHRYGEQAAAPFMPAEPSEARNATLEEAAKQAEAVAQEWRYVRCPDGETAALKTANVIRALKTSEPKERPTEPSLLPGLRRARQLHANTYGQDTSFGNFLDADIEAEIAAVSAQTEQEGAAPRELCKKCGCFFYGYHLLDCPDFKPSPAPQAPSTSCGATMPEQRISDEDLATRVSVCPTDLSLDLRDCRAALRNQPAEGMAQAIKAVTVLRDQADTAWGKENNGAAEGDAYNRVLAYNRALGVLRAAKPADREPWQPIETAPRDGTKFVAVEDDDAYPCSWKQVDDGEGGRDQGWWDHINQSFENPTLWAPLPAPPHKHPSEGEGR